MSRSRFFRLCWRAPRMEMSPTDGPPLGRAVSPSGGREPEARGGSHGIPEVMEGAERGRAEHSRERALTLKWRSHFTLGARLAAPFGFPRFTPGVVAADCAHIDIRRHPMRPVRALLCLALPLLFACGTANAQILIGQTAGFSG